MVLWGHSLWAFQEATSSKNLTVLDDWQHNYTLTLWVPGEQEIQTDRKEENRRRQGSESVIKRKETTVPEKARVLCTHETPVHWTRENEYYMSSQQLAWTICTHLCLMQLSALEEDRTPRDGTIQRSVKCREQALYVTFKPEGQTRILCKSRVLLILGV